MTQKAPPVDSTSVTRPPLLIVAIYCAFAALWIAVSDRILALLIRDPDTLALTSTYKGFLFVAVSGALLYFILLRRELQQRRARASLHESEARFRATFEQAGVGVAQVAPDGRWLHANQRWCDIIGYADDELTRTTVPALTHPEDREADQALAGRVLAGEIPDYSLEKRYRRKDGSFTWVNLTVALVHDADGAPDHLIEVMEDISARKEAEQALHEAMRRLRILSARLIEVQEAERKDLARELHDDIGQSLTAIKVMLQTSASRLEQNGVELDAVVGIADRALTHVRDLSRGLRPSQLDDLGLVPALRSLVELLGRHADLVITFTAAPELDARLPAAIETTFFRVAQEALTNVLRHATARHVAVALHPEADGIALTVADDGRGFDVPAALAAAGTGSLGLISMQERAELAGGRLDINSAAGAGTTLYLWLPRHLPGEAAP